MEIKGYITNLGKYNEGCLIGKWITFPISEEEEEEILKEIGINEEYEEYFFTDYECSLGYDNLGLGEYTSISHINEIAEALNSWSDEHLAEAVAEVFGIDDVMNNSEDDYRLYEDIHDDWDLGDYWINWSGCYDLKSMGNLVNYIDLEAFGRDIRYDSYGAFSSYGWVEKC